MIHTANGSERLNRSSGVVPDTRNAMWSCVRSGMDTYAFTLEPALELLLGCRDVHVVEFAREQAFRLHAQNRHHLQVRKA